MSVYMEEPKQEQSPEENRGDSPACSALWGNGLPRNYRAEAAADYAYEALRNIAKGEFSEARNYLARAY